MIPDPLTVFPVLGVAILVLLVIACCRPDPDRLLKIMIAMSCVALAYIPVYIAVAEYLGEPWP